MSRIVIADPQPFVRAALRQRLGVSGHEVVGETGDGRDALVLIQQTRPALVILDLELPRLGGIELIHRVRQLDRRQHLLVFTNLTGAYYQNLCLRAGASGFVPRSASAEELDDAIRLVLSGRRVFPDMPSPPPLPAEQDGRAGGQFTPRELTVLRYLADGYRIKDIAEELAISDRTVSTYKTRLLEKTQTQSLVDLIDVAKAQGLLGGAAAAAVRVDESDQQALAGLFDILPASVSLHDPQGRLLTCNRRFAEIHRKPATELVGMRIFSGGYIKPEQEQHAYQSYLAGVASGKRFSLLVPAHFEGADFVLRMVGVPLHDADGVLTSVVTSYVDVTERERYVEHLQEAKAHLNAVRAERTSMLMFAGEDMLGRLDDVLARLRQMQAAPTDGQTLVETIDSLQEVRETVDIVVDVARLEQGLVISIPRDEDLNRLTREAIEAFGEQAVYQPAPGSPHGWVAAFRYRHLLHTLLALFNQLSLGRIQITACCQELGQGELSWRLRLACETARGVALHDSWNKHPRAHLARHLAQLLGGDMQLAPEAENALVALIQLKLVKGSAPR